MRARCDSVASDALSCLQVGWGRACAHTQDGGRTRKTPAHRSAHETLFENLKLRTPAAAGSAG
eukprot:4742688-Prymnesium_polylepis.1